MAAKNKQNKKQLKRNSTIMMYARALNLHSIEAYQQWCVEQGFSTSVHKTQNQLECELKKYKGRIHSPMGNLICENLYH